MKIDIINEVVKPVEKFIAEETEMLPFAMEKGFTPIKINEKNFHELGLFSDSKTLVGVDGGNTNILSAPNFSVDFIRVVGVFYKENKRINIIKKEFFCFIKAENRNEKIIYSVDIIGDTFFDVPIIDSEISTLDGEKYNLEISSVAGMVRRFAELELAKDIINNSNKEISLVIDGSLKVKTKEELSLIKDLVLRAKEKNIPVGFLSKTCRLLTKNASSLNSVLNELGPKSSWYYYPVFRINNEDYLGEMYFVKLNSKSKYVFKLEIDKQTGAENYILSLALNSNDPVFYGYPYCLIEADKIARVSNKEKEYLTTIFLSKIKNKEKLNYLLSNLDAHDILDNIS